MTHELCRSWQQKKLLLRATFFTLFGVGGVVSLPAFATPTPANTLIQNRATINYTSLGVDYTEYSSTHSFRVDEIINFTVTVDNPAGVFVQSPQTEAALVYTLSNIGNGNEGFALSFAQSVSDQFDISNSKIYLDSNANGVFNTGIDTLYSPGVNDPVLAAETSIRIFVVGDVPAGRVPTDIADVNFTCASLTGAGPLGTVYNGAGDFGVDATLGVPGTTTVLGKFKVSSASATLTKSLTVLDPSNGNKPVQNAVITYSLTLNATGAGNLTSVNISDLIPSGTAYVANSIRLNGSPLTDAADFDAGVFTGAGIQVSLGTVLAPTIQTVTFKARIQ
jgi:uncharacterized repeat protein (TIGR01451 family)